MTTQSLPRELTNLPLPENEIEPLESMFERASDLEKTARHFIQENPTVALVGALAIGFLVGRLVMR